MRTKAILLVGAVAAGASLLFGKTTFDKYRGVMDKMQFRIKGIKGVDLKSDGLYFNLDMELINPTNVAIDIPGEQVVVKTLHFYSPSGVKLGIAQPNISDISMPANGSRLITNIPVNISLANVGSSFNELISIATNPEQLKITADLEAFGNSFSVQA